MDNQHRAIKGYRELSQEEIDLMNMVKTKGAELGELIDALRKHESKTPLIINGEIHPTGKTIETLDKRWIAIGETHLQQGLMALTRSIAKPVFF